MEIQGNLAKMQASLPLVASDEVQYNLPLSDHFVAMNPLIGNIIRLEYKGQIHCRGCGRRSRKSFAQGYCYNCFRIRPECDLCIVKPEQCHFHAGTCRDPDWGQRHCIQDHLVYLANTSGIKVGVTRITQALTRWMDQGACQALPIMQVKSRLIAGQIEALLRTYVNDKTNWRRLLQGVAISLDMVQQWQQLKAKAAPDLDALINEFTLDNVQILDAMPVVINYPVRCYRSSVQALNFDRQPFVEGMLCGIKGQYLMLDTGVLNIRKFSAYNVQLSYSL